MKKIVVASDSFKGSLTSLEVAQCVAEVAKDYEVIGVPIADGGEGSLYAVGGSVVTIEVHDPLMRIIEAKYTFINDGKTAFIEMAEAAGLTLLKPEERNPSTTTTFGVGEIIKDAIGKGCLDFYIGVGGSATNDAGVGMLIALGYRFLDDNHKELDGVGGCLSNIRYIDESHVMPQLANCRFTIACDVSNPFYGVDGAAYIFAPQKGADSGMVKMLDKGMIHFANIVHNVKGVDLSSVAGSGAGGGISGALLAFLNGELVSGVDMILAMVRLKERAVNADLIITGEGRLDKQTLMGKAPMGVLKIGKELAIPVIAIGGKVEDLGLLLDAGFEDVIAITPKCMSLDEAMKRDVAIDNLKKVLSSLFLHF